MGWLARAGIREPTARSFIVDLPAPLETREREALASIIEMRWGSSGSELTEADRELFRRLTDREGPDAIVDQEDYFGFFTYSLFWGTVS
jgi:demethylmenaquinone methyltransferase/2-methoxy-6-polyprenyl-1,4-benzoquinol methylase